MQHANAYLLTYNEVHIIYTFSKLLDENVKDILSNCLSFKLNLQSINHSLLFKTVSVRLYRFSELIYLNRPWISGYAFLGRFPSRSDT